MDVAADMPEPQDPVFGSGRLERLAEIQRALLGREERPAGVLCTGSRMQKIGLTSSRWNAKPALLAVATPAGVQYPRRGASAVMSPFEHRQEQHMSNYITVNTSEGNFKAYIARPAVLPAPAIVVIQEIFGVNADLRDTCDELAHTGISRAESGSVLAHGAGRRHLGSVRSRMERRALPSTRPLTSTRASWTSLPRCSWRVPCPGPAARWD